METQNLLFNRYKESQFKAVPDNPTQSLNLSISMIWSTVLKAAVRPKTKGHNTSHHQQSLKRSNSHPKPLVKAIVNGEALADAYVPKIIFVDLLVINEEQSVYSTL